MTLDAKYEQNVPTDYTNIMERVAWFSIDEISAQFLQALPNQEGIMKTMYLWKEFELFWA